MSGSRVLVLGATLGVALLGWACEPAEGELLGASGGGVAQGGDGGTGGDGGMGGDGGTGGDGAGGASMDALPCAPTTAWEAAWETLEDDFVALVNARRAAGGTCGGVAMPPRGAVAVHPGLRDVARAHAEHMAVHGYLGFDAPNGADWTLQPERCVLGAPHGGQSLAAGQTTAQALFDGLVAAEGTCVELHAAGDSIGVGHHAEPSATLATRWVFYIGHAP